MLNEVSTSWFEVELADQQKWGRLGQAFGSALREPLDVNAFILSLIFVPLLLQHCPHGDSITSRCLLA